MRWLRWIAGEVLLLPITIGVIVSLICIVVLAKIEWAATRRES